MVLLMTCHKCAFIAIAAIIAALVSCSRQPVDLEPLTSAMANGRFISYQPTSLKLVDGRLTQADEASIRADLEVLHPYFDSLITYGALNGAERIPDVAAALGYRAVIVGIWNPDDPVELANGLAAWQRNPHLVVGVSLGNEIVFGKRGDWKTLRRFLVDVHSRAPSLPLTVTEPFAQFLDQPEAQSVFSQMNFMLVNIHPIFETWFQSAPPHNWAEFVVNVTKRLSGVFHGPILVKETGVPTGPADLGYTEEKQSAFYRELESQMKPSRTRAFSYFSAFDAPWLVGAPGPVPGVHPEEAHWGLFTETRIPKPVVSGLKLLQTALAR
jgi:exo-beta-1,3-glucanase (GH17 family)